MQLRVFEEFFIWLIIYSVIGWIYETILCSVREKRFVNRGFLNGPYCPIYGIGALLNIIFLDDIKNPILLFLAAAILTSVLEYITSWLLEKLFHARWWDYTNEKFNLNGRIFLLGAIAFGSFSVILLFFVQPFTEKVTNIISNNMVHTLFGISFVLFGVDCVYTLYKMANFDVKLKVITEQLNKSFKMDEYKNYVKDKMNEFEIHEKLKHFYDLLKKINNQEMRMIKAFPKLKSIRYNDTLQKIKDYLHDKTKGDK